MKAVSGRPGGECVVGNGAVFSRAPVAGALLLAGVTAAAVGGSSQSLAATCFGNCGQSAVADGVVSLPPDGSGYYRWISTSGGNVGEGQLTGVAPPPVGTVGATNGTLYKTDPFTANAGDVLNYNFNYVTSDGQFSTGGFIYEDYAWAQIWDTANNVVATLLTARTEPSGSIIPGVGMPGIDATLNPASVPIIGGAPAWSPLGVASTGTCYGAGCGYTGWINSQFTLANAGTFILVFGVSNWGDEVFDSGLAFSGLTVGGNPIPGEGEDDDISEVPLPGSLPLFASAVAALGLIARRKRHRLPAAA